MRPFQSTLSVRRATHVGHSTVGGSIFQSTLSVRRATWNLQYERRFLIISIHALRKESDRITSFRQIQPLISIHALRKESDFIELTASEGAIIFQSTLSVRRATTIPTLTKLPRTISIHALRKESDLRAHHPRPLERISIHALRKESDNTKPSSTSKDSISIHALRKESDPPRHSPSAADIRFQSTLSVRRATRMDACHAHVWHISIHALRKESDRVHARFMHR